MRGRYLLVAATAASMALFAARARALPIVQIDGLSGATHWMWVEAENADAGDLANAVGTSNKTNISGHSRAYTSASGGREIQWTDLNLPTAMNDAHVYARYGSGNAVTMYADVNGANAGSTGLVVTAGHAYDASAWASVSIGSLAGGSNTIKLRTTAYAALSIDGMYITDGAASLPPATQALPEENGMNWQNTPTFAAANIPTLNAGVTPTITISGAVTSSITLDGNPYASGTPITASGIHMLAVEAFGASGGERILSGATFNIVPEPGSMGLLTLGGVFWAARRRRRTAP